MAEIKIGMTIEEASEYTGIGQEHHAETGGMGENPGAADWTESNHTQGCAGEVYGSK